MINFTSFQWTFTTCYAVRVTFFSQHFLAPPPPSPPPSIYPLPRQAQTLRVKSWNSTRTLFVYFSLILFVFWTALWSKPIFRVSGNLQWRTRRSQSSWLVLKIDLLRCLAFQVCHIQTETQITISSPRLGILTRQFLCVAVVCLKRARQQTWVSMAVFVTHQRPLTNLSNLGNCGLFKTSEISWQMTSYGTRVSWNGWVVTVLDP